MGGKHFESDEAFLASAVREVERLKDFGMQPSARVLDWGCGAGRLAVGIKESYGDIGYYHGVDVQQHLIEWAHRHLAGAAFVFTWIDIPNARYNPGGRVKRVIPGGTSDYDVFYAYSVLSHMRSPDASGYLVEISRLLRPDGFAFVTCFVEEGVPDDEENPPGYGPLTWTGPLHCVRFNRAHFERLVGDAGLNVRHFAHGQETDGQSLYVLGH
jgi:SAM-dependent methyltransferase